jgi:K+-transporting ATPase ATPase C chain
MREHILVSIRITLVLLVITCGVYPLFIFAVGQALFRDKANGSLITRDGKVIGSSLIGQEFTGERYFHPRPSAVAYDPSASGGSNLGPTSSKLRDRIAAGVRSLERETGVREEIPADAVTASCSGVDPHISPANAYLQIARVARSRNLDERLVRALIDRHIEKRFLGIYGEPRLNVLLVNLDLDRGAYSR